METRFMLIFKRKQRVLIIIEDDGPGIPEDQYKNVFKPFFRLDKSRSLNQSGVGLGLAIVEDIINSHGETFNSVKANITDCKLSFLYRLILLLKASL